ncbi:hypothetical protein B0A49_10478, partial [Cryomyces minteri]
LYIASAHPGNKFAFLGMQDAALPSSPESWTFFGYVSYPLSLAEQDATAHITNAQHLAHLRRLAADFADPFGTAFAALPADSPVWRVPMTSWDPGAAGHEWDSRGGRATLAGDAAHAMTYQRGQGLNHSLTDAGELCRAIRTFVAASADVEGASAPSSFFLLACPASTSSSSSPSSSSSSPSSAASAPSALASLIAPSPARQPLRSSQRDAIAAYEAEMVARGGEEVRLSITNTTMLHDWAKVLASPVMTKGMRTNASPATTADENAEGAAEADGEARRGGSARRDVT